MRIFITTVLAVSLVLLVASLAMAQGPELPPWLPDAPGQAPIDGGLTLLAAAGGAYAWKKLRNRKG